ncbi:MAG: hypothetical protein AB4426_17235 [Xenococcaceae cyanobacterium]
MVSFLPIRESKIQPEEAETYQALRRNLRRRQGVGIVFVRCFPEQGERIMEQIKEDLSQKKIATLSLTGEIDNLYQLIEEKYQQYPLDILFITGIEKSFINYIKPGIGGQGDYYKLDTVPPLLSHLNLQRERFRDNFNLCLVFLVPLFGLKYLVRRSPDFYDWRSGVFEFPSDGSLIEKESSRILTEAKEDYQEYLAWTPQERQQKILDIRELITDGRQSPETQAGLWREIGRIYDAEGKLEEGLSCFETALDIKPDDPALSRLG